MKKIILCDAALCLLKWGLAAVSAALLYIAFTTASLDKYDAARLHSLFAEQMEHVLMSLLIVVGGAVMLDIAVKEKKK